MRIGIYELNKIYCGDSKELALNIPDESIDLIFTDPVYENMDDYLWLSKTAMRILKPNKAALIFCGIGFLPDTLKVLQEGGLSFKWQIPAIRPSGFKSRYCMNRVFSNWQSLLWFEKNKSSPVKTISDVVFNNDGASQTYHPKWCKNIKPYKTYIDAFTKPGEIVIDFFTGGGSVPTACEMLDRNWLAFEIKENLAELAQNRIDSLHPTFFERTLPKQCDLLLSV